MAHNWQKLRCKFLAPCRKIYKVGAFGLFPSDYTYKILIVLNKQIWSNFVKTCYSFEWLLKSFFLFLFLFFVFVFLFLFFVFVFCMWQLIVHIPFLLFFLINTNFLSTLRLFTAKLPSSIFPGNVFKNSKNRLNSKL